MTMRIHYQAYPLDVITVNGAPWLIGWQIAPCVGLSPRTFRHLYRQHQSQVTPDTTRLMEVSAKITRIYSPSGLLLLSSFASSEVFSQFASWVQEKLKQPFNLREEIEGYASAAKILADFFGYYSRDEKDLPAYAAHGVSIILRFIETGLDELSIDCGHWT